MNNMDLNKAESLLKELSSRLSGYYTAVIPNGNPYGLAIDTVLKELHDLQAKEKENDATT